MPPKKRKRKAKTPKSTQRQSQRQSVVVNIGSTSKSKPRKSSGRGNLPPPSHMHNLAPTFVTAPQVDYTPLLAMMQHHASPIVPQAPMPVQNAVTPLSSVSTQTNIDARSPQQLAGEAALRRAGKTAGNFQTPASEARMRPEPEPIGAPQPRPKPSGFGQASPEQDLGGFLSPFGTVPPEAKKPKSKGRPAGAKNKPKDTSQTTIPFRRQGL